MLIFPAVLLLVQQEFGLGYASLGIFADVALRNVGSPEVGRAFGLTGVLGNVGIAASPIVAATSRASRWGHGPLPIENRQPTTGQWNHEPRWPVLSA